MLVVAPFFKGTTINKNKRLDHESLRRPETGILKYHEYIAKRLVLSISHLMTSIIVFFDLRLFDSHQ